MKEFFLKNYVGIDKFRDISDDERRKTIFHFDNCSFQKAVQTFKKELERTFRYGMFRMTVSAYNELMAWEHPSKEEKKLRDECWDTFNKWDVNYPDLLKKSLIPDEKGDVENRLLIFGTLLSKRIAYEYFLMRYDDLMDKINAGEPIQKLFSKEVYNADDERKIFELWQNRVKALKLETKTILRMLPKDYLMILRRGVVVTYAGILKKIELALEKGQYGSIISRITEEEKQDISKDVRILGQFLRHKSNHPNVHLVSEDKDIEELIILDLHLGSLLNAA